MKGAQRVAFKLVIVFFLLIVVFISIGFAQVKNAHPFELVNLSVSPSLSWRGMGAVPFPFRDKLAMAEFRGRSLTELEAGAGISNVYAVLGFVNYDPRFDVGGREVLERLVAVLLEKGMPVDAPDNYGCTPLQQAIISKDEQSLRYLISQGASWVGEKKAGSDLCSKSASELVEKYIPKVNVLGNW